MSDNELYDLAVRYQMEALALRADNCRLRAALQKVVLHEKWPGLQDGEIISDDDHPVYIALDALRVPGPRHVLKRAVDKLGRPE